MRLVLAGLVSITDECSEDDGHEGDLEDDNWPYFDEKIRIEKRSVVCNTMPMKRDEAIAALRANEAKLRQIGIDHLYLFGSTARDEALADSDIDLFFDHGFGAIGLYELMDIKMVATEILGKATDMIPRRGLHHVLRDRIEASAIQVF